MREQDLYWLMPHEELHPVLVQRLFVATEEHLGDHIRGTADFWVDGADVIVPEACLSPLLPEEAATARYLLAQNEQEDSLPRKDVLRRVFKHGRTAWVGVRDLQEQVQLAGNLPSGTSILDHASVESLLAALLTPPTEKARVAIEYAWEVAQMAAVTLTIAEGAILRFRRD